MIYTVKYEVQKSDGKIVSGEMPVEAMSKARAEEFVAHVLDEKFEDSSLLECQVSGIRE